MKKSLNVSINAPCSEKWGSFSPTERGAFCGRCQKEVVDMTKMTDRELLEFLKSRTTSTCGRLRKDQVRSYDLTKPTTPRAYLTLLRAAAASALLLFMGRQASAQTKSVNKTEVVETSKQDKSKPTANGNEPFNVSGVVVDETGVPMPGTSIVLQGAPVGTVSDVEGKFLFPQKLNAGQTLVFSFIGYRSKEFTIKGSEDPIKIELVMDNVEIMGELVVDEPYTIETKKSVWTRIKSLF